MTRCHHAFFSLLRSGLWGTPPEADGLPLNPGEWQQLYAEACRQTVQGTVYDALQRLPDDLVPPTALTLQWTADVAHIIAAHERMQRAVAETYDLLRQAGTEPVLIKGLASAHAYEQPQLRVNGDIDWFLPPTALATIPDVLRRQGIHTRHHADGSISFACNDTEIELHPRLADILWPSHQRAFSRLVEQEGIATLTIGNPAQPLAHVPTPGPAATIIIHAAHILKHAATVGIGLRQFCDMARACQRLQGHGDEQRLYDALRQTGLLSWTALLQHFLRKYLGLQADFLHTGEAPSETDGRHLLSLTLSGGNFGQHSTHWQQAHAGGRNRIHTLRSYCRHAPFALRYATKETLSLLFSLAKGQKNTLT